jgi:putative hemolysin
LIGGFSSMMRACSNDTWRRATRTCGARSGWRYCVFFEETGASPVPAARLIRRDVCRFDRVSDHLVVVDTPLREPDGSPKIVGVYMEAS